MKLSKDVQATTKTTRCPAGLTSKILIRILIPPLSVPESPPKPKHHNSYRRKQQHQNRPIEGLLAFFGRAFRSRIAHRAALAEAGHRANKKYSQQRQGPSFSAKNLHS
jgi:hypothetical protein